MSHITRPSEELLKLPLEERAEMAMKSAAKKVVENAIRNRRSIHIWEDGKVVEVTPEELMRQAANGE